MTDSTIVDNGAPRPQPSPLVFWLLIGLGFLGLTPCVLLPEWREYQEVSLTEQQERHKIDSLKRVVEREDRGLEALQTDPAAVARLARRDLRFHRPGETVIHVPVDAQIKEMSDPFVPQPVPPPPWLTKYMAHLPALDYDAVFCHGETRNVITVMSLSMIAIAMILYRKSSSV